MALEEAPPLLRPKALCELCGSHASVFCPSDDAHLCVTCDAKVHSANFLVSRHCRVLLCSQCRGPTPVRLWGPSPAIPQALCPYCCDNFHLRENLEPCFPDMWRNNNGAGFGEIADGARVEGEVLGGQVLRGGEGEEIDDGSEGEGLREGGYFEEEEGCSASPVSVLSSEDCSVPSQNHDGDFSAETQTESEQSDCHGGRDSAHCVTNILQLYPRLATSETSKHNTKSIASCSLKRKREGFGIDEGQKRNRVNNEVGDKDSCSSSSFSAESPDPIPGGLSEQAAARLKRVLSSWQLELGLSEDGGIELAMKFLQRALKRLQPKMRMLGADTLRITLATCLWLSLKLGTEQAGVPKASQVAEVTGVSASRLRSMEIQLLGLLDWRPLEGCLDKEAV